MKITMLKAAMRLAKRITKGDDGQITKTAYPNAYEFTSQSHDIPRDPEMLLEIVRTYSEEGACLLSGPISHEIVEQSRAGTTASTELRSVFIIDADGVPGVRNSKEFLAKHAPELLDVTHIEQFSASHGLPSDEDRPMYYAHLIFISEIDITPSIMKLRLMLMNLTSAVSAYITLSSTKNSLKWPIDVTVCQNDKLIFTCPPDFVGMDDPVHERIRLVPGKRNTIPETFFDQDYNDLPKLKKDRENALRKAEGLKAKTAVQFRDKITPSGVHIARATEQVEFTDWKFERGFCYLSLNNGRTHPYYTPVQNPEILYNFKGEDNYLLKEISPSTYSRLIEERGRQQDELLRRSAQTTDTKVDTSPSDPDASSPPPPPEHDPTCHYFTFIDKTQGSLQRARYCPATNTMDIWPAPSMYIIKNFQRLHDLPRTNELEEWEVRFDPHDLSPFQPSNGYINTFKPTIYLLNANRKSQRALPKLWAKYAKHVCGNDEESFQHLLNWIAALIQLRDKLGTTNILHGAQGTGKDIIIHRMLAEILGREHVVTADADALVNDQFNSQLRRALLVFFNENDMDAVMRKSKYHKLMKELTTEQFLMIRAMRMAPELCRVYFNIIIFANERHSITIPENDRRNSVLTRQDERIYPTDAELEEMYSPENIQAVTDFFMSYEVDMARVRTPLQNDARAEMQELSLDSHAEAFKRLIEGDGDFFFNQMSDQRVPGFTDLTKFTHGRSIPSADAALITLFEAREHGKLDRNVLESLIFYTTGKAMPTPHKFAKWARHNGWPRFEVLNINNRTQRGIRVRGGVSFSDEIVREMEEKVALSKVLVKPDEYPDSANVSSIHRDRETTSH